MSTMIGCFDPVGRYEYLDRLGVLAVPGALSDEFWDAVHIQVQAILSDLDDEVCRQVPSVRAAGARTKGRNFLLCSYRTFEPPSDTIDAVVAGITFTAHGDHVVIDADISGEQGGDLIAALSSRTVASSKAAVVDAAREAASELARFGKQLATAICDVGRTID